MSPKPKLYTNPGSQHCRRVALLIHETGMDVDTHVVDVRPPGMGGENESEAFLGLNPNGKVPVLTHGESFVLLESNAIMIYLCEQYGDDAFWPADAALRAQVLSWQFWQAAQLSSTVDGMMRESMLKPMLGMEPDPGVLEALDGQFRRWAAVLESTLGSSRYLLGDRISLADLSVAAALMYTHAARLPVRDFAATSTWFERIRARASWQATEPPPMPL